MKYLRFVIIVFSIISLGTFGSASCLLFNENERLSNFCLLKSVEGKVVDKNTAIIVTQKLKREGYFGGLENSDWSTSFYPGIDYSENVNGGNPDRSLVLGDLEFVGDPELIKQEGVITTLNMRVNNRSTLDAGKYFQTNLHGSYSYSPKHKNGFSTATLESCFTDKITSKSSIDICASSSMQKKEISENRDSRLSVYFGNLNFNKTIGFSEGKLGIMHLVSDEYSQNQFTLSWDTIHNKNLFSAINFRIGDPVRDQTALRYGLDINVSKIIMSRKINLRFSNEIHDGGLLFGIDRSDVINKFSIQTVINQNASIHFGYTSKNSNIDYFDERHPSLSLTFIW